MRTLRFSAFLAVAIVPCASAQSTQPSPSQQPAAVQAPDKNQAQPQPAPSSNPAVPNNKDLQPVPQSPKEFKFKFSLPKREPADKKLPTGIIDRGFRASTVPGSGQQETQREGKFSLPFSQPLDVTPFKVSNPLGGDPQGRLDRGIYASDGIGGTERFCGSIVSYNFSRGHRDELPVLESVTTCTPSNKVVPRRAQGENSRPAGPHLMQTVLSSR
jgi:hypothetical protein